MLVCNVSLRPSRRAIAAGIAEVAAALDAATTGNVVFAALVDDPASVREIVDAYLGEIMLEAAGAADAADAGFAYTGAIAEAVSAGTTQDGTVTAAPAATTWNPSDKSASVSLTGGNLVAASSSATAGSVRGTNSVGAGKKVYLEIKCTYSIINDSTIGVATAAAILGTVGGTHIGSAVVNIFGGAMYVNNTTSKGNIGLFNSNDVLCVALDMTSQNIWFRRNNGNWNNSGTADPSTNSGGHDVSALFTSAAAFPLASFVDAALNETINAGASAFTQTIPSGFVAWNSAI